MPFLKIIGSALLCITANALFGAPHWSEMIFPKDKLTGEAERISRIASRKLAHQIRNDEVHEETLELIQQILTQPPGLLRFSDELWYNPQWRAISALKQIPKDMLDHNERLYKSVLEEKWQMAEKNTDPYLWAEIAMHHSYTSLGQTAWERLVLTALDRGDFPLATALARKWQEFAGESYTPSKQTERALAYIEQKAVSQASYEKLLSEKPSHLVAVFPFPISSITPEPGDQTLVGFELSPPLLTSRDGDRYELRYKFINSQGLFLKYSNEASATLIDPAKNLKKDINLTEACYNKYQVKMDRFGPDRIFIKVCDDNYLLNAEGVVLRKFARGSRCFPSAQFALCHDKKSEKVLAVDHQGVEIASLSAFAFDQFEFREEVPSFINFDKLKHQIDWFRFDLESRTFHKTTKRYPHVMSHITIGKDDESLYIFTTEYGPSSEPITRRVTNVIFRSSNEIRKICTDMLSGDYSSGSDTQILICKQEILHHSPSGTLRLFAPPIYRRRIAQELSSGGVFLEYEIQASFDGVSQLESKATVLHWLLPDREVMRIVAPKESPLDLLALPFNANLVAGDSVQFDPASEKVAIFEWSDRSSRVFDSSGDEEGTLHLPSIFEESPPTRFRHSFDGINNRLWVGAARELQVYPLTQTEHKTE